MKTKVISTGTMAGAKGGNTKMFGKQSATARTPGITSPGGTKAGAPKGGSTKMFGRQSVKPSKAR